jgi:hypothetical protein
MPALLCCGGATAARLGDSFAGLQAPRLMVHVVIRLNIELLCRLSCGSRAAGGVVESALALAVWPLQQRSCAFCTQHVAHSSCVLDNAASRVPCLLSVT